MTQEHEEWDALLACQGQLRLAPSGHVIGIHLDVALKVAGDRDYDVPQMPVCGKECAPSGAEREQ